MAINRWGWTLAMHSITNITIENEILKLLAEIDEFNGRWTVNEIVFSRVL